MTTWQIVLMVLVIVLVDGVLIVSLFAMARGSLKELSKTFPGVAVLEGEGRTDGKGVEGSGGKRFCSIRVGMMKLGSCVHITVDRDHLHLEPTRLARWMGLSRVSVPWGRMKVTGRRWGQVSFSAGGVDLSVPDWAVPRELDGVGGG